MTADKVKKVKAVALEINGKAHTSWSENDMNSNKDNINDSTTYTGNVDYIKSKILLFETSKGAVQGDEGVVIEPGVHSFAFSFHIPTYSPSSFESFNGYIRYWIQVALKRPWKFDQTYTRGFTVINVKDLNQEEDNLKMPVSTEISKVFCCGPCKSDPLQMHVQLPQAGYVPGQLIPVNVLITNETKAPVDEICLRLVMTVNLYSTSPIKKSKQEYITIAKLKGDAVLRQCKKHFNYLLPIPATPPTCFTLCSIIQIGYRVEVEAKINGIMYTNQCIHIPVTIGNVPLQMEGMVVQQQPLARQFNFEDVKETQNNVSVMALTENNNNDPNFSNRNIEPWSCIGNIPPPVYMTATHMPQGQLSTETMHDYGEKSFTPKYPVFDMSSPISSQPTNADEIDGHVAAPTVTDPDKSTWL